jgi:lactoylglutathione lyase
MKLAHTMIRVKDLQATLEFYTEFLGLKETRRKEIGDEATLVFLADEAEHYHIELTVNHGKTDYTLGDQFGHLAFFAEDLDLVIEEVERRGWPYRTSRPELSSRYIFVKDPNGYDVEILERRS